MFILIILFLLSFLFIFVFIKTNNNNKVNDDYNNENSNKNNKIKKRIQNNVHPYPIGWIRLLHLPLPNQYKEYEIFGEKYLVFVDNEGKPSFYDPYCPHLGANLCDNINESNKNNDGIIQCPFHGLKFDGNNDGKCKDALLNLEKKEWIIEKQNNMWFLWYSRDKTIPWKLQSIFRNNNYNDSEIIQRNYTQDIVYTYPRDIAENAADFLHFPQVHNSLSLFPSIITFDWKVEWKGELLENKKTSVMELQNNILLFGKKIPFIVSLANVHQIGPYLVSLQIKLLGKEFYLIQSTLPIKDFTNLVYHQAICKNDLLSKILSSFVLYMTHDQFKNDIKIWNNKRINPNYKPVKQDGPIIKFRKWFRQFEYKEIEYTE